MALWLLSKETTVISWTNQDTSYSPKIGTVSDPDLIQIYQSELIGDSSSVSSRRTISTWISDDDDDVMIIIMMMI